MKLIVFEMYSCLQNNALVKNLCTITSLYHNIAMKTNGLHVITTEHIHTFSLNVLTGIKRT
jgi:hypothetical protein